MKTVVHLPLIRPEHYAAFRGILKEGLPATHEEWEALHSQQITDCYRQGLAHTEIAIIPEEFSGYCRTNGYTPKAIHLRKFAREKATKARV